MRNEALTSRLGREKVANQVHQRVAVDRLGQVVVRRYAIWYIMKNQVYLGMVPRGKFSNSVFMPKPELHWGEGRHEPLIDPDTFARVQARLTENKHRQRGGPAAPVSVRWLLQSAGCRGQLDRGERLYSGC